MSALCAIVLLSALSQTFAQNFLLANQRLNILQPNRALGPSSPSYSPDAQLEETDLNSPYLSEFAAYNLQVQKQYGIYPQLFDVSFSPNDIGENFYNEAVFYALENGLYEVGSLPQQLADAAIQAFPRLTPLEYFKAVSNTFELILQHGGIGTEGNYQVLARLNANALKYAMDNIRVNDPKSALHAIIVGAGKFVRSLSFDSPDDIRFAIATLADQLSKVPSTGGYQ